LFGQEALMMCHRSAILLAAIGGILFGTSTLLAHDFWLEPSSFRVEPGTAVELRLRVGEHFIGDALPRNPALLAQFIAAGPAGLRSVPGQNGMDPAGVIRLEQSGLVVVGFRSRHSAVDLKPEAFNAYLAEEGLDHIAAVRGAREQPEGSVRELFSRCAKALLLAGAGSGDGHDRVLGFTLELIPDKNPYAMRAGDSGSRNHAFKMAMVGVASGVHRSLRPLPMTSTCAPVPTMTSFRVSAVSSDRRSPAWTATKSSA